MKQTILNIKCITNISETTVDDAEHLGLVMQMYNLIEYSSNYFEAAGNLWFYFKNKATSFSADIANHILNGQNIVFSLQLVLIILIVLILIILFLLSKRQNYMFL